MVCNIKAILHNVKKNRVCILIYSLYDEDLHCKFIPILYFWTLQFEKLRNNLNLHTRDIPSPYGHYNDFSFVTMYYNVAIKIMYIMLLFIYIFFFVMLRRH